jgi:hypothetical protein
MFGPARRAQVVAALIAAGGWVSAAGAVRAQPAPPAPVAASAGPNAALAAERVRLRAELERVNGEIDALKRAGGVSERLRERLADAEGIARRLMTIEAHLGIRAEPVAPAGRPLPPPTAARGDGPADLDAKADILADQSRRLRGQAEAMAGRAREIKARQELRRRSSELDRDPFAAMEGAKRRVASAASAGGAASLDRAPSANTSTGTTASTPMGGGAQGSSPTSLTAPGGAGPLGATSTAATAGPSPMASANTLVSAADSASSSSLAVQLRDLLDTASLADIRRLEARGASGAPQALERAAAALRARAAELDTRARQMRAQAHPTPPPVVSVPNER